MKPDALNPIVGMKILRRNDALTVVRVPLQIRNTLSTICHDEFSSELCDAVLKMSTCFE